MAVEYTLWMQKTKDGSPIKDSLGSFGFAVCDMNWPAEETADVAKREWPGEHGEDVYISPSGLKLKAYDLEVQFSYKGSVNTAQSAHKAFRDYLAGIDGSGGELKIYDPYWRKGRQGVFVKKIGDLNLHRSNADESLSAKVTLRVADPATEVSASVNSKGNIIGLT